VHEDGLFFWLIQAEITHRKSTRPRARRPVVFGRPSGLVSTLPRCKARKLCEDCADRAREEAEIGEASEGVIQGMMGYKGRR
jgi:hypothetical protein